MDRILRALTALVILLAPLSVGAYIESAALPAPYDDLSPAANAARLAGDDFRYYNSAGTDAGYLAKDRSVFLALGTDAGDPLPPFTLAKDQLRILLFLGKGTKLPGGLSIGGPGADIVRVFGPVYPLGRADVYDNEPRTGMYTENTHTFRRGEAFRCYTLTYFDRSGRYLQFLVDRKTKTIAAAAAWQSPSLSRPDAAAADALSRWGLWRLLRPEEAGGAPLAL